VIVYLWDAPGPARTMRGISGDETAARQAAETCLLTGQADAARVEAAVAVLEIQTLTSAYRRTGRGWQARRGSGGSIKWEPLGPVPSTAPFLPAGRPVP
jgi:hypothetical protein